MVNNRQFLKNLKNNTTKWSSNLTSGYLFKRTEGRVTKNINTLMFKALLFIITKRWKEAKCSSTNKYISKMWYTHIMQYYSVLKRQEILSHATWMNLKHIMLTEVSQPQRDKYHIPLIWVIPLLSEVLKFTETKYNQSTRGWEEEVNRSFCLMGFRVHFTRWSIYNNVSILLNYTFKNG